MKNLMLIFTGIFFIICSSQLLGQTISETAGTITTVTIAGGEVFADPNDGTNGGLGGDCSDTGNNTGNYPNCDCVTVTTLTAPAGQQVSVTFSQFTVFGNFDWLAIFDGDAPVTASNASGSATNPTSANPVLWNSAVDGVELINMFLAGKVTFTSTNGSLTFASRFSSVINRCGWEADVAVCQGLACPQSLAPIPSTDFVTIWEVNPNDVITIPLQSGTYDFDYTWKHLSDTISITGTHTNSDGDFTTNFVEAGTYQLSIDGQFFHLKDYPVDKLKDVIQWGDIQWGSMENMFQNWQETGFLAVDEPDLSQATDMRKMFLGASNFNENLNHWDVSNIDNMAEVFRSASQFNGNITNWDVSNVTFFFSAFNNAVSFNQDISDWDVSNVGNMHSMFDNADAFNQAIGKWDVSKVSNFKRMLAAMANFNQPLGNWKFNPNTNINFSQFSSGTNNMSCENYSSTILGWNFNNPTLANQSMGGFNADYDSIASIARNELLARGWSMSAGTDIGGDCGTVYEFACQDTLSLGPDTLYGTLIISANDQINLDSIFMDTQANISISAPEVNLGTGSTVANSAEIEILQEGCTNSNDSMTIRIIGDDNIMSMEQILHELPDPILKSIQDANLNNTFAKKEEIELEILQYHREAIAKKNE